jgi:hypothetical protein
LAGQDSSLIYAYLPTNSSDPTVYVDVGIASSLSNLHSWEVCYVTYQTSQGKSPLVSVLDSRDIQLVKNPPIIGRFFVFESPNNYTQVTLYWYESALFNTGLNVEKRFVRISLIILTQDTSSIGLFEEQLLDFAFPITEYWEPLKTQSLVLLNVSVLQWLLVASLVLLVVLGATQYTLSTRKKSLNLKLFSRHRSKDEKLLYKIVKEVNEGSGATVEEIAQAYEQATGKKADLDELSRLLRRLLENNIIDLDMKIVDNVPYVVWKP